jgi:hypothetical protein
MAHVRQIHITQHAYERYCQRVEPISYDELVKQVEEQAQYSLHHKRGYVQIAGTWWRGTVSRTEVVLHTCYGESHIDMPKAVKWAKRHGDRLALGSDRYAE